MFIQILSFHRRSRVARATTRKQTIALGFVLIVMNAAGAGNAHGSDHAPGLLGEVYADSDLRRPAGVWMMDAVDERTSDWPRMNDWSLRVTGFVTAPLSGPITLFVDTPHAARLLVDDRELVRVWPGEGAGSGTLEAQAGRPMAFVLEYRQNLPPSRLRLRWQLPGREPESVPAAALSHDPTMGEKSRAAGLQSYSETLLVVSSPDPGRLPSLRLWRRSDELLVAAEFPQPAGFVCDSWCYEGELEIQSWRDLGEGRMELRHRSTADSDWLVVTEIVPEPGAVAFHARLQRVDGATSTTIPEQVAPPNLCWQLKNAPEFGSAPDPYPEFVARCFIFTERGRTFLHETMRRPIPAQRADSPKNNPPWVQLYGPAWEPPARTRPGAWADYSNDRFTASVVGAVSRDGKHLAAIASDKIAALCQAWHDCMHVNGLWIPSGEPATTATWSMKIYVMENDPDRLLHRVADDFADVRRQPAFSRPGSGG